MVEQITTTVATSQATPSAPMKPDDAGSGVSLTDVSAFGQSMEAAAAKAEPESAGKLTAVEEAVAKPLDYINMEASEIVEFAQKAAESGKEMTPGEVIMLTAKSHEFMFHAQLTANVANRTSEGLQQLFRQQG